MLENWYWFWYWIVSGESIGTGIGPKKVVLLISGILGEGGGKDRMCCGGGMGYWWYEPRTSLV